MSRTQDYEGYKWVKVKRHVDDPTKTWEERGIIVAISTGMITHGLKLYEAFVRIVWYRLQVA